MIEFEGKIKMIAVPIPFNGWAPGNYQNNCWCCKELFIGDKLAQVCLECAIHFTDRNFEIIGLSSEILKSEELAKRCVEFAESKTLDKYMPISYAKNADFCWTFRDSFQSLLDKYNIKSEHLILEVK